jgi:hypothetical protein
MRLYFPRPYPDEAIGSVLTRASRHLGLSPKVLAKRVLQSEWGTVSFFLPIQLDRLADLTQMSKERLIFDHTFFPYATAYMAPTGREKLLVNALSGQAGLSALFGGISRARQPFRYCLECRQEDFNRYGETYWHRSHLLPAVFACPVHGHHLMECPALTVYGARGGSPILPHEAQGTSRIAWLLRPSVAAFLAQLSADTLSASWRLHDNWTSIYRTGAARKGYTTVDSNIASEHIAHDLQYFYGHVLLQKLGCAMGQRLSQSWPALLLRPVAEEPASSLRHILLSCFVAARSTPSPYSRRRPGPRTKDVSAIDAQIAKQVSGAWNEARAQGALLGVQDVLERLHIWTQYRHDRARYPLTQQVIARLRSSAEALRPPKSIASSIRSKPV